MLAPAGLSPDVSSSRPMLKKLVQRTLITLGVVVNLVFLGINLRPDRPHLARHRSFKLLLRADPARAKWIADNELGEFEAANDVKLEVISVHSFEDVLDVLEAEKQKPTGLLLATIDSELSDELRGKGALRPIADGMAPLELADAVEQYLPEAIAHSRGPDHKLWFIPRRAEVDVAVYLGPAVEDVYLHWEQDRGAITAALAEVNRTGLPRDYAFEKNPNGWNSYDLFVAAWYWAHHPAPWSDSKTELAPRAALRTGDNDDALHDLFSAFYRHGFTDADIGKTDVPAVIDALQWEGLFRKHHLLAAACEAPDGIDSDGVNNLFKARKLAWIPINQEDSLWLHGGAQRGAERGITRAHELGWAMLPTGASLELANGKPARIGRTFSVARIQLWAVPVHASDPKLAFALASFLTQRGLQQRETEAQGLLPIRQDLRADYSILFRLSWMQRILAASYHQLANGSGQLPPRVAAEELDVLYQKLRARVVYARPQVAPVTFAAVQAAVQETTRGK